MPTYTKHAWYVCVDGENECLNARNY